MKANYSVGIIAGLIPALYKFVLYLAGSESVYLGRFTNLEELIVITIAIPVVVFITRRQSQEIESSTVVKSNGSANHPGERKKIFPFIDALKTGIGTAVIAALIVCTLTYVHLKFIKNEKQQIMVEQAIKYAAEQKMNEAETEKNVEGARQYFMPSAQATTALFGIMVWGFLVSVVSAVALKKES